MELVGMVGGLISIGALNRLIWNWREKVGSRSWSTALSLGTLNKPIAAALRPTLSLPAFNNSVFPLQRPLAQEEARVGDCSFVFPDIGVCRGCARRLGVMRSKDLSDGAKSNFTAKDYYNLPMPVTTGANFQLTFGVRDVGVTDARLDDRWCERADWRWVEYWRFVGMFVSRVVGNRK